MTWGSSTSPCLRDVGDHIGGLLAPMPSKPMWPLHERRQLQGRNPPVLPDDREVMAEGGWIWRHLSGDAERASGNFRLPGAALKA